MINDFINEVSYLYIEMAPYLILGFLISGFLYLFTSKEMITKNVGTPGFMSVLKAAILGVPMPLCSCGVIPVSTSMYKRGATKGATLSFLISTPQTGVDSILLTLNQMGPQFAIIRPVVALITGVIGGLFGDLIGDADYQTKAKVNHQHESKSIKDGLKYAFVTLPQDIVNPLIKGIILSGLISVLLPSDFFVSYNLTGISAMVVIALASVPIYVCATASVPIAMVLISKGLEPGAAFVFLMAGPATNAATISVIMNSLGKKIVYVYISIIFISSIIFGLLINAFLDPSSLPTNMGHVHSNNMLWNIFSNISLYTMLIITGYALFNQLTNKTINQKTITNQKADLSIIIKGMTCNHCKESAMEAIQACNGVEKVTINLENGQTIINGKSIDEQEIIESVNGIGFSVSKLA
tara:strand:+ start:66 stop:1295 length:1230 start_codon:yes stop_codon:yes gene_type:complete